MEFPRRLGPWRAQPSLKLTTTQPGTIQTAKASCLNEVFELHEIKYAHLDRLAIDHAHEIVLEYIKRDPDPNEATVAYLVRLRKAIQRFEDYLRHVSDVVDRNNVVGRVQEERQSGNDPGDDEDGTRRENVGSRLRGRGTVR